MKKYIYKGLVKTTLGGYIVVPGSVIELSEKDERVKSLLAQGLLELVETKKQTK
ncbi:hypothetical protein CLU97_3711 [Chryseobacterium sp. 7]|jgi:hypothetical protein|uniref:hypothetical protein n=1 Tax=Chryseobacterium sp. 7 TaxID=2035214 RepID=UPI000F12F030|nr:hypothetical protein [Chryseobacterium sp. 7]RLJ34216.1 hypothetical protein CLU97_3711 [Chryseobacterium sp. 7]